MKIFLKTSAPVLVFLLVITLGFAFWLVPNLNDELTQWDHESERSGATILAEALSNDMKAGQLTEVATTLSRIWANRPDWALVEAYDAQGTRFYPATAGSPPSGLQKVSVRITASKERLGSLVIYFDGSLRASTVRHAIRDFVGALLAIGTGLLALTLLLHWVFVTTPIKKLRQNFSTFDSANRGQTPATFANDELGELSKSFEHFRQELVHREQALSMAREVAEAESQKNLALRVIADEANKAKSNFLSMVSHELRTPMNAIMGMTSVLINGQLDAESRLRIKTVEDASEHLLAVINQILEFSSAESGSDRVEVVSFDLYELVAVTMRIIESLPAAQALHVAARIDENVPPRLQGDARRIKQVLLNLLGNAIKFTSQGSVSLHVSATFEPADRVRLCLAVSDTGPGITASMHQKIFDPFVKMSNFSGGTGLGLSICRHYALMLAGDLTMQSTEGVGSTFTFCAPLRLAKETERLQALKSLNILDTDPEAPYDALVASAARICDTPIALISLVDKSRQWFKAKVGLPASETPREYAFCAHAILNPGQTMVVRDATADARFASNPLVTADPHIRFYAGVPLTDSLGQGLGTLCVIDTKARELSPMQLAELDGLAQQASRLLQTRSQSPLRVLVAEDTPTSALVIRLILEGFGHTVRVVGDGQQAVQALLEGPFDLVFMDIQMPVMDGLEATRVVRQHGQAPAQPPIVGCSAFASDLDRQKALDSGMNDYLVKPLKAKDVLLLIARLSAAGPAGSRPAPL